ncbi:MAG: hypothetical protein KBD06_02250 [Candidatus Pacebacteria bacterium]|nr:hypothetical protein [Candidatus Paceibacterota bacterium]
MKHTYATAAVIAVVFIGVVLFTKYDRDGVEQIADTTGGYAYVCADGVEFRISPASDMSSIRIIPGSNAPFQEADVIQKDTQTYGTGDFTLTGAGEHVRLITGGVTYECDPVPSQTDAPFNWGDPSEGAGASQDAAAAVRVNIVGKWRSVEDPLFVREFFESGNVLDSYDEDPSLRQAWTAFTKGDSERLSLDMPLDDNTVYVAIYEGSDPQLIFSVDMLTPEALEMTYMDRGNKLKFTRVQ